MPVAKTHEPDKRALAALLNRAKGDRTLKEFAGFCNVNPSTLTRIMQQTNRGSSTLELITAIADNAAPESGVMVDALLNANGYTRIYSPSSMPAYANHAEAMVRSAILNELLFRNADRGWAYTSPGERVMDFVARNNLTDIQLNRMEAGGSRSTGSAMLIGADTPPEMPKSSTIKYVCPSCGNSVRATKTVNIACIDCNRQMIVAVKTAK